MIFEVSVVWEGEVDGVQVFVIYSFTVIFTVSVVPGVMPRGEHTILVHMEPKFHKGVQGI